MTAAPESALKPCPFCGGEAQLINYSFNRFVKCKSCGASSDDSAGVLKWNTRAGETK